MFLKNKFQHILGEIRSISFGKKEKYNGTEGKRVSPTRSLTVAVVIKKENIFGATSGL